MELSLKQFTPTTNHTLGFFTTHQPSWLFKHILQKIQEQG